MKKPMRRRSKAAKAQTRAGRPVSPQSRTVGNRPDRRPPKRLADALKGEAEGLEQQAATAEILRVISSSPSDVQPVFDAIVRSTARLCDTYDVWVGRLDG